MSGTPSLPGCWKVRLQQQTGTLVFENVLHVSAPTTSNPIDVANDVGAAWASPSGISAFQSNQVTYEGIFVQPFDGVSAETQVFPSVYTGHKGQSTTAPSAINSCVIATLRTGLAGRSHRGRVYFSGVQEGALLLDGTRWDGTYLPTIQARVDNFHTLLNGSSHVTGWVVYSHKLNVADPITQIVVRQYIGSQRRRSEQAQHH